MSHYGSKIAILWNEIFPAFLQAISPKACRWLWSLNTAIKWSSADGTPETFPSCPLQLIRLSHCGRISLDPQSSADTRHVEEHRNTDPPAPGFRRTVKRSKYVSVCLIVFLCNVLQYTHMRKENRLFILSSSHVYIWNCMSTGRNSFIVKCIAIKKLTDAFSLSDTKNATLASLLYFAISSEWNSPENVSWIVPWWCSL